jgi:hypothetical protein
MKPWHCPACRENHPNLKRHYWVIGFVFLYDFVMYVYHTVLVRGEIGWDSEWLLSVGYPLLLLFTIVSVFRSREPWANGVVKAGIWTVLGLVSLLGGISPWIHYGIFKVKVCALVTILVTYIVWLKVQEKRYVVSGGPRFDGTNSPTPPSIPAIDPEIPPSGEIGMKKSRGFQNLHTGSFLVVISIILASIVMDSLGIGYLWGLGVIMLFGLVGTIFSLCLGGLSLLEMCLGDKFWFKDFWYLGGKSSRIKYFLISLCLGALSVCVTWFSFYVIVWGIT